MGEAIACLEGLKMAIENSTANVVIETDCAAIIDSFKETSCNRSEVGMIAKEFSLLKPPDRQVTISKVMRSCNKVAHNLCQLSRSVLCGGVLQGAVPTCALEAALEDCNNYVVS
jgi:ribonuclease HI